MRQVILIRHAAPEIVEGESPKLWRLSEKGRKQATRAASALGSSLYLPDKIITSRELKAVETGQIIADALHIPVEAVDNLHEHDRTGEPFFPDDIFIQKVTQFFAQPDKLVFGRESADTAFARFKDAVQRCLDENPDDLLGIVAHGTVLSLYIGQTLNIDPHTFLKSLRMASIIILPSDGQLQVIHPTE